ncbi:MAG: hypothetical protein R2766_11265 [Saprospiraceae bacterium]
MLNHYSPFKVAEVFNSLEVVPSSHRYGNRKGNYRPYRIWHYNVAIGTCRQNINDSGEQLVELLHWMNQDFPEGEPFADIKSYNNGSTPEFWLLGSSEWSSMAATTELGLPYAFAGFIQSKYVLLAS